VPYGFGDTGSRPAQDTGDIFTISTPFEDFHRDDVGSRTSPRLSTPHGSQVGKVWSVSGAVFLDPGRGSCASRSIPDWIDRDILGL
jgi:hypothetical protein